jgi:Fe-S cluster assembly protein SufD
MTQAIQTIEKVDYLQAFAPFSQQRSEMDSASLQALRKRAAQRFQELGWPTRRLEAWKYTDVSVLARSSFERATSQLPWLKQEAIQPFVYDGCHQLVFVNGHWAPELSRVETLPKGCILSRLAEALLEHQDLVEPHLGKVASFEHQAFAALNTAYLEDGAFIYLSPGTVIEKPIHLLFVSTAKDHATVSYPRTLVVAQANSQATIIESYVGLEGSYFTCPVTEIAVDENATIDHYKIQREHRKAFHLATMQVQLGRNSRFSSLSVALGGALARTDLNASLEAEGADCTLNGLYLVKDDQRVDHHINVDHRKPHGTSHQLFKGLLDGKSRAIFSGKVYVHPNAQKTDAQQSNRNLLLSDDALVHTNPQLEIFADDVKCSHGATVGQLDKEAIFYLRSRGLDEVAARRLLTYGFASDVLEQIKISAVRDDLEQLLSTWLPA